MAKAKSKAQLLKQAAKANIPGRSKMTKAQLELALEPQGGGRQTGGSDRERDLQRKAKRPGKRRSASGRTYYEYRRNRSDVPPTMLDSGRPPFRRGMGSILDPVSALVVTLMRNEGFMDMAYPGYETIQEGIANEGAESLFEETMTAWEMEQDDPDKGEMLNDMWQFLLNMADWDQIEDFIMR